MAYVITDDCISCGSCEGDVQCPTDSISEGPDHYQINPDTCIDCGACAVTCPIGAIKANL